MSVAAPQNRTSSVAQRRRRIGAGLAGSGSNGSIHRWKRLPGDDSR
jgi:hypothetical protein